CMQALECPWTF
nr:immunoglobulin light chain junction region [Macaca mulatta]MOX25719.1 immunoglobulin light chain junction region [Macaca mulatta]MOX99474.1 immunoglobulin light chain junction region [Macaca mulatta]